MLIGRGTLRDGTTLIFYCFESVKVRLLEILNSQEFSDEASTLRPGFLYSMQITRAVTTPFPMI